MNKIKKLAEISYKGKDLDEKLVLRIANSLNRGQLKGYLKEVKKILEKQLVHVYSAKELTGDEINTIEKLYGKKKVIAEINPKYLAGLKIIDSDTEYDATLSKNLNDLVFEVIEL